VLGAIAIGWVVGIVLGPIATGAVVGDFFGSADGIVAGMRSSMIERRTYP
jgi:hypothetical protein